MLVVPRGWLSSANNRGLYWQHFTCSVFRTSHGSRLQNSCTIAHSREERLHNHRCSLELESETIPAECTSKAFQLGSTRGVFPLLDKASLEIPSTFNSISLPAELMAFLPPLGSSEGASPCRQLQSSESSSRTNGLRAE